MEAAELPLPLPAERRMLLGAMLVRDGLLTPGQLEEALAEKEESGRRLGEIVVEHGWLTPAALARALAEQHGLDYIELTGAEVEASAAQLLPEKFARRYGALPVRFLAEDLVLVAVADPTNVVASDDLRMALGLNVRLAVIASTDLERALAQLYRVPIEVMEADADDERAGQEDIRESATTSAPAIKLVNSLIARAIDERASDLHFEPQAKHMIVRARVDGVMRAVTTIPRSLMPAVTSLRVPGRSAPAPEETSAAAALTRRRCPGSPRSTGRRS